MPKRVVGTGSAESHARVVDQLRGGVPPLFDFSTPMPYVELQKMLDEANAWGLYAYDKACYVSTLSDEVIDVVTEHFPQEDVPLSLLLFYRLDGAYSVIPDGATAFSGGRSPRFGAFVIAGCPVPEMVEAERAWARATADALRPLAADGAYVNGITDFEGDSSVQGAYGSDTHARLAAVKATYDPDNVFHGSAAIAPA